MSASLSRRQFLGSTAGAAATAASARAQGRPNIVFLTTDEHRTDALGCSGNRDVQTPNLDRMAGEGVRFTNTYCQGPLCQPSRASIITGQYVKQHRHSWNRFDMKPEWPTMMKAMQKAGYTTAALGKMHFGGGGSHSPSKDLRQGAPWTQSFGIDWLLEEYDRALHTSSPDINTHFLEYLRSRKLLDTYLKNTPAYRTPGSSIHDYYSGKTTSLPQEHTQTSFLADNAVDWVRGYKSDNPFFLWVSFIDPHPPLVADAKWAERYRNLRRPPKTLEAPDLPDNAWGRYLRTWMEGTGTLTLTPEMIANGTRAYYGMISLIDQRIGDIVKAVRDRGWGDNTWFFFTADHGEMLGEHRLVFKNVFYRPSVTVPNIIRPAGGTKARVVNGLTQSIDITATMLDVAGATLPTCEGRSLRPLIKGEGRAREVAYSELAGHQGKGNYFVMAATDRYRYTYDKENDIACELFDLEKDPGEMHNLVRESSHEGIRKDLHKDYVVPFMKA